METLQIKKPLTSENKNFWDDPKWLKPRYVVLSFALIILVLIVQVFLVFRVSAIKSNLVSLNENLTKFDYITQSDFDSLKIVLYKDIEQAPYLLYQKARDLYEKESNFVLAHQNIKKLMDQFPNTPYSEYGNKLDQKMIAESWEKVEKYLESSKDPIVINKKLKSAMHEVGIHPQVQVISELLLFENEQELLLELYSQYNDTSQTVLTGRIDSLINAKIISENCINLLENDSLFFKNIYPSVNPLNVSVEDLTGTGNQILRNEIYGEKNLVVEGQIYKIMDSDMSKFSSLINRLSGISLPEYGGFVTIKGKKGNIVIYIPQKELLLQLEEGQTFKFHGYYDTNLNNISDKISEVTFNPGDFRIPLGIFDPTDDKDDIILIHGNIIHKTFGLGMAEHINKVKMIYYEMIFGEPDKPEMPTKKALLDKIKKIYLLESHSEAQQVYEYLSQKMLLPWIEAKPSNKSLSSLKEFEALGKWKSTSGNEFLIFEEESRRYYKNLDSKGKWELTPIGKNRMRVVIEEGVPDRTLKILDETHAIIYTEDYETLNFWTKFSTDK